MFQIAQINDLCIILTIRTSFESKFIDLSILYDILFTKKKNLERFTVNSPLGLALERFYLERRGDGKEIFRLGSKKVDKKVKQRTGFIELNVLE